MSVLLTISIGLTVTCTFIILLLFIRMYMKNGCKRCTSTASMKGKVVIVTGATGGIGYHTARDLAARGARVILACRDEKKATAARDEIIAETGNKNVVYRHLNLSSLLSVKQFAREIDETEPQLDVLINNAGVHGMGDRTTADGIVEGVQINFFAPFLLTILLLPKIKASKGRIVNLTSMLHYIGNINLDKINKPGYYNGTLTYCNGKLCMILFTKELAKRLEGSGVTVNAVHPGVILTNVVPASSPWYTRYFFVFWCWLCCRTAELGAQTVIYLAVADEVENVTGQYFIDCEPRSVMFRACNVALAKKLWAYAENLVGLNSS